LNEEFDPGSG